MRKLFLSSAAALALVACGDNQAGDGEESTTVVEAAGPELGDWGIALEDIDPEVDPGDNFYRHVNGKWLDSFEIPDEFSSYGSFTVLFERSEERVRTIIEDLAGGNASGGGIEQKIGDFYASFVDVDICFVLDRSSSMKLAVSSTATGMSSSDERFCDPPWLISSMLIT